MALSDRDSISPNFTGLTSVPSYNEYLILGAHVGTSHPPWPRTEGGLSGSLQSGTGLLVMTSPLATKVVLSEMKMFKYS